MSLLQIHTAVPLAEPLLEQEQQQQRTDDDDDDDDRRARVFKSERRTRTKFVVVGALTGFFIQVVSLGAYVCILVNFKGLSLYGPDVATDLKESGIMNMSMDGFFQQNSSDSDSDGFFGKDAILYTILSVLTQMDLVVYVLIWVAFSCTMTRHGMTCIRSQFFSARNDGDETNTNRPVVQHRYVFVLGVCFLVGIVLGAFGAWTAVDVYLGFPIPFKPILATVAIDLALCYLMVWCFDMGGWRKSKSSTTMLQTQTDECC